MKWNSVDYHKNSFVQKKAAFELIQKLDLTSYKNIIDVGCGDGKITAEIASLAKKGKVIGLDSSNDMINFSKLKYPKSDYPNLDFICKNAMEIDSFSKIDLIFSSFCLQWVEDIDSFFSKALKVLNTNGIIVGTVPLNFSIELEEAIEIEIKKDPWKDKFHGFKKNWFIRSADLIENLLKVKNFKFNYFKEVTQSEFFDSSSLFLRYISQWLPYLSFLSKKEELIFLDKILINYLNLIKSKKSENILFSFSNRVKIYRNSYYI